MGHARTFGKLRTSSGTPGAREKLPLVLSAAEVRQILGCLL
jgi:hypothetical protein